MSNTNRFGAVPLDFMWALERGDISADEFMVGAYLVCAADRETHEVIRTLRALAESIGWEKSLDALGRTLARLREKQWIAYDVKQGQRAPWVIRLTWLDRESRSTSAFTSAWDPPSGAEVGAEVEIVGAEVGAEVDGDDIRF